MWLGCASDFSVANAVALKVVTKWPGNSETKRRGQILRGAHNEVRRDRV